MKQDLQIFNLIKKEEERQTAGIELIASENYVVYALCRRRLRSINQH